MKRAKRRLPHRKAVARAHTVTVGQGLRGIVLQALTARYGRTAVRELGFDGSSTLWSFRVRTTDTAEQVQDTVWAYQGLSSISCEVS